MNRVANHWKDYECIDAGNGEKLERWGNIILRRPDPAVIWPSETDADWQHAHAHYHRSKSGGGHWEYKKQFKDSWTITYKNLRFKVSPTGFKHTGLFPEQAANWDFMMDRIANEQREIRVLNLFAYSGGCRCRRGCSCRCQQGYGCLGKGKYDTFSFRRSQDSFYC